MIHFTLLRGLASSMAPNFSQNQIAGTPKQTNQKNLNWNADNNIKHFLYNYVWVTLKIWSGIIIFPRHSARILDVMWLDF